MRRTSASPPRREAHSKAERGGPIADPGALAASIGRRGGAAAARKRRQIQVAGSPWARAALVQAVARLAPEAVAWLLAEGALPQGERTTLLAQASAVDAAEKPVLFHPRPEQLAQASPALNTPPHVPDRAARKQRILQLLEARR